MFAKTAPTEGFQRILLVDDDEQLSDILGVVLESHGYEVESASNSRRALELLATREFACVLLDLRLGDEDGLEVLPRLRDRVPNVPIFMITAHGDVESAVDAFRLGVSGYIRKPFREGELRDEIARAIERARLKTDISAAERAARDRTVAKGDVRAMLQSRDPIMEPLIRKVLNASQVLSNVVIHGESGTGKERVARALHRCGPRAGAPFAAFNCAALPDTLIESELFGHMRGAYTDAKETKSGLFARAAGGTLFLDEIGDASPAIQAKLLRVLQEREFTPLGGTQPIKLEARVVTATHKSLSDEVAAGRFRQDLYYRLHVLPIHIPALRERKADIVYLAAIFAGQLSESMGYKFDGFTPSAERAMLEHPWPGNVRELQNRVEHALAVSGGGRIGAEVLFPESVSHDLPPPSAPVESTEGAASVEAGTAVAASNESVLTFVEAKASFERSYLTSILRAAQGNIARAARLASKSRTEVYGLLKKHGMDPTEFKREAESGQGS